MRWLIVFSGLAAGCSLLSMDDIDADGDGFCPAGYAGVKGCKAEPDCDNNDADVNAAVDWFRDKDGDGFGDPNVIEKACPASPPEGFIADNTDCDDSDSDEHPGAEWFEDGDGDGFGAGAARENGGCRLEEVFDPENDLYPDVQNDGDCLDDDDTVHPAATELCDGQDNDCDGNLPADEQDNDAGGGDGYVECTLDGDGWDGALIPGGDDCDDTDNTIYPTANEVVGDGIDQDCDTVDDCYEDADDDDVGTATVVAGLTRDCATDTNRAPVSGDCNDSEAMAYPGASEVPGNDIDEDCNDNVDCFVDGDGDAYGAAAATDALPASGGVPTGTVCSDSGDAYDDEGTDCNDSDNTVYPGRAEVVGNDLDEDCNGFVDCYIDNDNDDHGSASVVADAYAAVDGIASTSCGASNADGYDDTADDCDDTLATIAPGLAEVAGNDVDEDCSGFVDCYEDVDMDGHGGATVRADAIAATNGQAASTCDASGTDDIDNDSDDCNDSDITAYPGASELPGNDVDEDCNGNVDCYVDADMDDYGSASVASDAFTATSGVADTSCALSGDGYDDAIGDCNDDNAAVFPTGSEVAGNDDDEDCNGFVDCYDDADGDDVGTSTVAADALAAANGTATTSCSQTGDAFDDTSDDCNDGEASVYPGATETPGNDIDEDCNDAADCFVDTDQDGHGSTATATDAVAATNGQAASGCGDSSTDSYDDDADDCHDGEATAYPGNTEVAGNDIDEDCNDSVDCYEDNDDDGFGSATVAVEAYTATAGLADTTCDANQGDGYDDGTDDCDDGDATVHPGAVELCDGQLNDCTSTMLIDEIDADGDSYVACVIDAGGWDGDPGVLAGVDCLPDDWFANPGQTEVCGDAIDTDCSGDPGNGCPALDWYADIDGDGWGDTNDSVNQTYPPAGYVPQAGDCALSDPTVHPWALEVCGDAIDNDCDPATGDDRCKSTHVDSVVSATMEGAYTDSELHGLTVLEDAGQPYVFTGSRIEGEVYGPWLPQRDELLFADPGQVAFAGSPTLGSELSPIDHDGDGDDELVVHYSGNDGRLEIWDDVFGTPTEVACFTGGEVGFTADALPDRDGDLGDELLLSAPLEGKGFVVSSADFSTGPCWSTSSASPAFTGPNGFPSDMDHLGDVDGDGEADYAVVQRSVGSTVVLGGGGEVTISGGDQRYNHALGDLNLDGYDDFAINDYTEGDVYIVFGRTAWADMDLTTAGLAQGVLHLNAATFDTVAMTATSGDFNGDGRPDVALADPSADGDVVWIVQGPVGPGAEDLEDVAVRIDGGDGVNSHKFGSMLDSADFDQDGYDDLVVGAQWGAGDGATGPGEVWVLFGSRCVGCPLNYLESGFAEQVADAIIQGKSGEQGLGYTMAPVGDIDGDGLVDLFVGGLSSVAGGGQAALFTQLSSRSTANDAMTPDQGGPFAWFTGFNSLQNFGYSVTAGNFGGQIGELDIVVSERNDSRVFVVLDITDRSLYPLDQDGRIGVINLADTSRVTTITHSGSAVALGDGVQNMGDLDETDGNLFDDLLITDPNVNSLNGAVYVVRGPIEDHDGGSAGSIDLQSLGTTGQNGNVIFRGSSPGHFGSTVTPSDELDSVAGLDFLIGAPTLSSDKGSAYLISNLGSTSGEFTLPADIGSLGSQKTGPGNDQFGWVALIPDVNGDGKTDFYVGESQWNSGAGRVHFYSGVLGWSSPLGTLQGTGSDDVGARTTPGTANVGDVNGDGVEDFVVTRPRFSGGDGRGMAHVFSGGTVPTDWTDALSVVVGKVDGGRFGGHAAGIGDANGDGYADYAVRALDGLVEGYVYVFFGGPEGTTPLFPADADAAVYGASGDHVSHPAQADLDGDGYLDLVLGGDVESELRVHYGPLTGSRSATTAHARGGAGGSLWNTYNRPVGDVNGDSIDEFLIPNTAASLGACSGCGGLQLLLGDSTRLGSAFSLVSQSVTLTIDDAAGSEVGTTFADAGWAVGTITGVNDNLTDILVADRSYDGNKGRAWLMAGNSGWMAGDTVDMAATAYLTFTTTQAEALGASVAAGDLDGNGKVDVALWANLTSGQSTAYVFFDVQDEIPGTTLDVGMADETVTFEEGVVGSPETLAIGDVSSQPGDELLVLDEANPASIRIVSIASQTGPIDVNDPGVITLGSNDLAYLGELWVDDLNRDGWDDVVASRGPDNVAWVLLGPIDADRSLLNADYVLYGDSGSASLGDRVRTATQTCIDHLGTSVNNCSPGVHLAAAAQFAVDPAGGTNHGGAFIYAWPW